MAEDNCITVLDHGYVRLVDHMGSDLSIVRAARNSYNAEPRGGGEDEKLIHYLMENFHTSPFEMGELIFDVKLPIFVARQWVRHRTASINEVSARYTELPKEFYVPKPEDIGEQSASSKQARDLFDSLTQDEMAQAIDNCAVITSTSKWAHDEYKVLLERGVPREAARIVLTLNTYTRWYWKTDLHNLFHFLRLRMHKHAQYEMQLYAKCVYALARDKFPTCFAAFENFKPAMLSKWERDLLRVAAHTVLAEMSVTADTAEDRKKIQKLMEKLS